MTGGEPTPDADFSTIRYAQVWEDADVLLEGLDVQPGDICLSIASGGDNTLALLVRDPAEVVAVDLSRAQLACLELRIAAYRALEHAEVLELIGSRPSARREALYARCRPLLSSDAAAVWDARPRDVAGGVGAAGKFERYFAHFRRFVLPLVHSRARVERLLAGGSPEERRRFYDEVWNTRRWRLLFRIFFSRFVLGRLGRDPSFFRYVEGSVADAILARAEHAVVDLDPAENPYAHWILTGHHGDALPLALREQHFDTIRGRVDRVRWLQASVSAAAAALGPRAIDRFNLSDVFEYMSPEAYAACLETLCETARPGGRLAYWNLLAPRRRPEAFADRLRPRDDVARPLHERDKAFFYGAFVVEERR